MSYPPPPQINAGEWNAPLYISAGINLNNRKVTVTIIRPDGSSVNGNGVIAQNTLNLPQSTFRPGEWVIYMVQRGDLPVPGLYTVQLDAVPAPPTEQLIQSTFMVGPLENG